LNRRNRQVRVSLQPIAAIASRTSPDILPDKRSDSAVMAST
jgi:hypothetical protein